MQNVNKVDGSVEKSHWRLSGAEQVMAEQCQAHGVRAAVAAAAPQAATIGLDILRKGGNAYDAAVAAALAETVLLPPKCGLAGDLVALAWARSEQQPEALIAIGGAAAGLADAAEKGLLAETGPMSVGVPAAHLGYLQLAKRGRLPLSELAKPAIELAEKGFCWSRICSVLSVESQQLVERYLEGKSRYYPAGQPIAPHEIVTLPGLARLLTVFVTEQADLYSGDIGRTVVERVQRAGGIITLQDLVSARAEWLPPASIRFGDYNCYATPAPTHGVSLLDAIHRYHNDDLSAEQGIAPHILAAIKARQLHLADVQGTSMVSAVDQDGTQVTVVHSNSFPRFGSGLIVNEYDLILNNRAGRGFNADPAHPNFPVKGRRPATTLHAWGLSRGEHLRLLGATPGGANQMPWNAQTLARFLAGETDIGRLIAAPRWQWTPGSDAIVAEQGFSDTELKKLQTVFTDIRYVDRWDLHSAMQITAIDHATDKITAAADPRTVGLALAL